MSWAGSPGVSGSYLDLVSPCCGYKVTYENLNPEKLDTYLTDVSLKWVAHFKCAKCEKIYKEDELLNSNEEWANKNRTELIDRMLNE